MVLACLCLSGLDSVDPGRADLVVAGSAHRDKVVAVNAVGTDNVHFDVVVGVYSSSGHVAAVDHDAASGGLAVSDDIVLVRVGSTDQVVAGTLVVGTCQQQAGNQGVLSVALAVDPVVFAPRSSFVLDTEA